jgi:hypothetical protein
MQAAAEAYISDKGIKAVLEAAINVDRPIVDLSAIRRGRSRQPAIAEARLGSRSKLPLVVVVTDNFLHEHYDPAPQGGIINSHERSDQNSLSARITFTPGVSSGTRTIDWRLWYGPSASVSPVKIAILQPLPMAPRLC